MGFYSRIMKKRFDNISAKAAQEMYSNGALLVDVRSLEKYQKEHAHGALHISEHEHPDADLKVSPAAPRVLIGDNSAGSLAHARRLSRKGFRGAWLSGGYESWQKSNLPVSIKSL